MIRKTVKGDDFLIPIVDVKAHLRVDSSFDDSIIYQIMRAAQDYAEQFTGRAMPISTFEFTHEGMFQQLGSCDLDRITIRKGEITQLVSCNTYDQAGAATAINVNTFDIINYDQYSEIIRKDGSDVPRGTRTYRDFVLTFKAGYTEATLPLSLRLALLELMNFFYECRDGLADGSVTTPDHTIRAKLVKFRLETL